MENKVLAVIILNWNGISLLKKFLPAASLFTSGDGVQLFVADNGSTDGSVEWIKKNLPWVEIISFEKNYGFAEGYNKAIEATRYEYTLLLNSDVEVPEGWWQPLLEYMEAHPVVAAVQPKIKSFSDKRMFEYAGAAGGYLDRLGYPYCRGRIFDRIEDDHGQYDGNPAELAWASGACLMVRTKDFLDAGGLDHRFFAHMEEIDLCVRLIGMGKKVMCVPQSEVYHVGGASLPQGNPHKTYLNFRNNLLLLYKSFPKGKGRSLLFFRRLADTAAWLMFLLQGDLKNAGAIVRAHSDFRKMKKHYSVFPERSFFKNLKGTERLILLDKIFKSGSSPK